MLQITSAASDLVMTIQHCNSLVYEKKEKQNKIK